MRLEDALDRAQHELTGVAPVQPQWSPYVRLLRRVARLLQRGGGRTPSRGTAQPAAVCYSDTRRKLARGSVASQRTAT
jgi:hypothetical protein